MLFALPDHSVVVTSFVVIELTASGHGDFRPSPLAILPNRPDGLPPAYPPHPI